MLPRLPPKLPTLFPGAVPWEKWGPKLTPGASNTRQIAAGSQAPPRQWCFLDARGSARALASAPLRA